MKVRLYDEGNVTGDLRRHHTGERRDCIRWGKGIMRTWRNAWGNTGRHRRRSRYRRRCIRLGRGTVYSSRTLLNCRTRALGPTHERPVSLELGSELFFRERLVFDLWTLAGGLADRTWVETKFDFLAPLVVCDVGRRDALHTENFDFVTISSGQSIINARKANTQRQWAETRDVGGTAYFSGSSLCTCWM